MGENGSFDSHIAQAAVRAKRQTNWILRTFRSRDTLCMKTLFKSTVLPIVEYCSQLWAPIKVGLIRKLESVERNFTARIENMRDLSYWERLNALEMYSLERRRERYAILYVFKIIIGKCPNLENNRFKIRTTSSNRRGLFCVLPPICAASTARTKTAVEQSFSIRGPRLFNCLPINLRSADLSFVSFKRNLDKWLGVVKDQPFVAGHPVQAASNSIIDQVNQMARNGTHNEALLMLYGADI